MFTLLMANIQRETLICVSNSDREGAWTQLHLLDGDPVVGPSQVCPCFPGPDVGSGHDVSPSPPLGDSPEAAPGWWGTAVAFCACCRLSVLSLTAICSFKGTWTCPLSLPSPTRPGGFPVPRLTQKRDLDAAPFEGDA